MFAPFQQQPSPMEVPVRAVESVSSNVASSSESPSTRGRGLSCSDGAVKVNFSAGGGYRLVNSSFKISGFSVTDGQDPDQKTQNCQTHVRSSSGSKSSSFRIGRKGTRDQWIARIPYDENTKKSPPDRNVAFIGKLELTLTGGVLGYAQELFTLDDVAIVQGQPGTSHNWWFGGKNCQYPPLEPGTVRCPGRSPRGTWHFDFLRGYPSLSEQLIELKALSTS